MEDDYSSMISSAKTNSNYAIHHHSINKRPRLEHHHHHHHVDSNINIATPSSTKFKGVVPQQNGHWGAQIYTNHQRIWLGTFKSEKAAAMAYDSAAIKLRSGDSQRNFPWTSLTIQEPDFQSHHTTETVLNMIKDSSYQSKFEEFVSNQSQSKEDRVIANSVTTDHDHQYLNKIKGHGDSQFLTRQLFQKELTPSDVGKLNRLVIPKKYAVKYFPYISEENNNNNNNNSNSNNNHHHVEGNGVEDIELVFYDKKMRPWRFRYCYWRSSQSFVFTRGWNRFVKENNLKANDIITFYACEQYYRTGVIKEVINGQSFCLIDVTHRGVNNNNNNNNNNVESNKCLNSDNNNEGIINNGDKLMKEDWKLSFDHQGSDQCRYNEEDDVSKSKNVEEKGFRLFGVDIKS